MLSIIIVNYKSDEYTKNCIKSIKSSVTVKNEIITVDNSINNCGFAKAANLGAKKARGEYLLFLNPDTQVKRGDFKELINYLDSNPKVGIVGLKMILEDGSLQPHSFGNKFSMLRSILTKLSIFNFQFSISPDWVSGGAMVVRKNLFDELDGFDEQFFMYFEDQDLCLRAKKLGYKVELWKSIEIVHFGGKPLGGKTQVSNRKRQLKMYYESQGKFIKKHYGWLYWQVFRIVRHPYKVIKYVRL